MHFALLIIFTNLSMATLPSLGHPSEWSTLPRNELNPSARTQVPCAQYFSFAHLRINGSCSSPFHFSCFNFRKSKPRSSQSSPPSPSTSLVLQGCKVSPQFAQGLRSLSRAGKGPVRFYCILMRNRWKINRISSTIWSYVKVSESDPFDMRSPWLGRWKGLPIALQQSKLIHSKNEILAMFMKYLLRLKAILD